MYHYLPFTLPVNTLTYAWGTTQMISSADKKVSLPRRLLQPFLIALVIGAALGLTGIVKVLPTFLTTTLNNLSACMGPVAMILTGFIIGGYNIKDILYNKKIYVLTILRLIVLPAIILTVLYLLGADLMVMTMALVAFSAALGLNTVVIPAAYGHDTKPGASMALISHVAAVFSLPLMYALLCHFIKG